jgi:hypothetical protein
VAGIVAAQTRAGELNRLVRQIHPTGVRRHDREVARQRRHDLAPGVPALRPPGDQQQRRPFTTGHGVQADIIDLHPPAGEDIDEVGG